VQSGRGLPQVVEHLVKALRDRYDFPLDGLGGRRRLCLQRAELHGQRYEPLLRAVMEVTLDLPSRLVSGGDDPGARGEQLSAALHIRKRRAHKIRELRHTGLCVSWGRSASPAAVHHAPEPSFDDDRRADA
jgi:hypothetical protein